MRPTPKVAFPAELVNLIKIERERRARRRKAAIRAVLWLAVYALCVAAVVVVAAEGWSW
ncbi:hypothetical protein [Staphylococcus capitis]|uniref:hypothetical protein n=1 Tax=Staphylococcus capitis TaxID=29388 RepID=UPI003D029E33